MLHGFPSTGTFVFPLQSIPSSLIDFIPHAVCACLKPWGSPTVEFIPTELLHKKNPTPIITKPTLSILVIESSFIVCLGKFRNLEFIYVLFCFVGDFFPSFPTFSFV